jgi:OMF family outer membrane factor
MRTRPSLLLCLAWVAAASGRNLSLSEALGTAANRDPQSRSDSVGVDASLLQASMQRSVWLPSVGVQASYNRLSNIDEPPLVLPLPAALGGPQNIDIAPQIPNQWGLSARADQMLWEGGKSIHLERAANWQAEAGRASRTKSMQDMTTRVATAYWNLSASQASLQSAKRALASADSQAVLTAVEFRQGTALEQDTLQARLRMRQLELQVEQASASRETARQALCVALGLDIHEDISASDSLAPLPPPTAPATTTERPEIEQARAQASSAEEQAKAARAAYSPQIAASAEYDLLDPNPRVVPNRDSFDGSWRVGVVANWNLFRGGMDEIAARTAQLQARQARLREVAVRDADEQDLALKETNYRLAVRRREIAQSSLPLARRDLELALIRAQVGTSLRLDAIDRESALSQEESDLAQAIAQENAAALALTLARGQEPSWK